MEDILQVARSLEAVQEDKKVSGHIGMGAVLEQEQEEDGRVVKKVIAYASKTLNASQQQYCPINKELLVVVTAVGLFKYYLTGRHFFFLLAFPRVHHKHIKIQSVIDNNSCL